MEFFQNVVSFCTMTTPEGYVYELKEHLNMPIGYDPIHDQTLDTGAVVFDGLTIDEFDGLDVSKPFEPFSLIVIVFEGQSTEIRMIVQKDTVEEQRKEWKKTYKHNVSLIEETKKLERKISDTVVFSTPIDRHYDAKGKAEWETVEKQGYVLKKIL